MTAPSFQKATKTQARLRLALFGPSGAGKTFTALRLAKGIGGKVALIDTERGSASKYADRFEFDTMILESKAIPDYVVGIRAAAEAGYQVLVIDSLTHGWRELLAEVDKLARAKYQGNTWSAWSEGTPKQAAFIEALLDFPGHVIATMRSKTEWATEKDEKTGKTRPVRVGLAPEEGKGIEYEFDLLIELNTEHMGTVIKDRSGKYQDEILEKPGEDLGKDLAAWLSEGAPAPASAPKADSPARATSNGATRPYPPAKIQAGIQKRVADHLGERATDQQGVLVLSVLTDLFDAEPDKEASRQTVLAFLFGKISGVALSGAEILALIDWLKPTQDSGDMWVPDPMAAKEARAIHAAQEVPA